MRDSVLRNSTYCDSSTHFVTDYFDIPKRSNAIIALTCLDERYFKYMTFYQFHNLEFVLYRLDAKETQSHTYSGVMYQRGISCELELEAGHYAVYVSTSLSPALSITTYVLITLALKPRIDRVYYCGKVGLTRELE